jgi:hypothetical protein
MDPIQEHLKELQATAPRQRPVFYGQTPLYRLKPSKISELNQKSLDEEEERENHRLYLCATARQVIRGAGMGIYSKDVIKKAQKILKNCPPERSIWLGNSDTEKRKELNEKMREALSS